MRIIRPKSTKRHGHWLSENVTQSLFINNNKSFQGYKIIMHVKINKTFFDGHDGLYIW